MTLRTLLVTGATGFVGRHVLAACRDSSAFAGWRSVAFAPGVDIRDGDAVARALDSISPDAVIHLAAQSFVPRSFDAPRETLDTNTIGTLNLLECLRRGGFAGRLLYVSSGDVYGQVPEMELPVSEATLPRPRSPYAVSKLAAEMLCLQAHRTHGLSAMIARPFNHIGPGQGARFVIPSLARQLVAISRGDQPPRVEVGDIETTRDFSDVRDVVAAYSAIIEHGHPGSTYVVGSGQERTVREILQAMCALVHVQPAIESNPELFRPGEQRRMVADSTALRTDTGWSPRYTLDVTLGDILEDARRHYG